MFPILLAICGLEWKQPFNELEQQKLFTQYVL